MGARPEDYERSAPNHSFIHVDNYESPKALGNIKNSKSFIIETNRRNKTISIFL